MKKLISGQLAGLEENVKKLLCVTLTGENYGREVKPDLKTDMLLECACEQYGDGIVHLLSNQIVSMASPDQCLKRLEEELNAFFEDIDGLTDAVLGAKADLLSSDYLTEYLSNIAIAISQIPSSRWSDLITSAQSELRAAMKMHGSVAFVSSILLDWRIHSVFLLEQKDMMLVKRHIVDDNLSISDYLQSLEHVEGYDFTLGSKVYVVLVNGKFAPDWEDVVNEDDVLTLYTVKLPDRSNK